MEIIAGRNPVLMSLRLQRREIHELLIAHGAKDPRIREAIRMAREQGIPYRFCTPETINRLVPGIRHQGIAIRASALPDCTLDELIGSSDAEWPLLIALDQVQDPHNLGAIIRAADAVGATGLLISQAYAAGITPTIARTSAGSVEALPLVRVPNLIVSLRELQQAGYWLVGTNPDADTDYWELDAHRPLCVVLGNEGQGLRRRVQKLCDLVVRIPTAGHVESLNVSVATGVLLYEILRQRRGA